MQRASQINSLKLQQIGKVPTVVAPSGDPLEICQREGSGRGSGLVCFCVQFTCNVAAVLLAEAALVSYDGQATVEAEPGIRTERARNSEQQTCDTKSSYA